jgi:uncharacterized protein YneF (UPF0154 family)
MALIIALLIVVSFLLGVGSGGVFVRKEISKDIERLENSKITDGQFRDIVVNSHVLKPKA